MTHRRWLAALAALALIAGGGCPEPDDPAHGDDDAADDDAADDDGADDDAGDDDGGDDDSGDDDSGDDDTGGVDCSQPLTAPTDRIWPIPGELFYAQLGLGGFSTGESAVVVGPDGMIMAIDVGNDSHDDDVRDLIEDLVLSMNASGYPGAPFPADSIDHVVITHFHGDHGDGLEDLLQHMDLTGKVIHRGFLDVNEATGEATLEKVCNTLDDHPGAGIALCEGPDLAPCDPTQWIGSYPSSGCPGLDAGDLLVGNDSGPAYLELGGGARMEIAGIDATIAGDRYEDLIGPLMTVDVNGENARSIIAVLRQGPFRLLFGGDLTGGGSDTDPVEAFIADRLTQVSDLDARGVDVMQANHHGRNTSSSEPWADQLLPADGYSRNMVIGVSAASSTSPHEEVLETVLDGDRLADGYGWTTLVAVLGDSHPLLVDAGGGHILITTIDGGAAYHIQAIGTNGQVIASGAYHAVRTCQ